MPPRIAIPMPHSTDHEYGERAIPQYERAVLLAGGEAVRIPLDRRPEEVGALIDRCDGVLLPGSNADIDPARFEQARSQRSMRAPTDRKSTRLNSSHSSISYAVFCLKKKKKKKKY